MRTSETFFVLPRIPSRPIEACDIRTLGLAIYREVSAADHKYVAGPTFNNLRFNGLRPNLIPAVAVDKNATVPCIRFARRPGLATPTEFGDEFIVREIR